MSKSEKRLAKMKENPRDWRIEDLKTIAEGVGIEYRQKGSHVTFHTRSKRILTVPAHQPVKPVYVKRFVILIEELMEGKHV